MRKLFLGMAVAAALLTTSARAEVTDCQEILSVPVIITTQGVHCFKSDKVSSATSGNLIDIQTNNVTIDMNGFKLGGSTGINCLDNIIDGFSTAVDGCDVDLRNDKL